MTSPGRKSQKRQRAEQASMAALGLPDFETAEDCNRRQQTMIRALERLGVKRKHRKRLQKCTPDTCPSRKSCSEACHYGARRQRLRLIPQGQDLLAQHPGPIASITIAHPTWEVADNDLKTLSLKAAKQWLRRRLLKVDSPNLLAIGSFETCLNVGLDGTRLWAGQFHLIVAGATVEQLKEALALGPRYKLAPYAKPTQVKPIKALGRQLGYSLKRFAEQRIAYDDDQGRQNRRHLPLDSRDQATFDLWLSDLKPGDRLFLYGCRRRGGVLSVEGGASEVTREGEKGQGEPGFYKK
jgi:hypothetical protein